MAPAKEERLDIAWLVTCGKRTGVYNAENKAEECKMATFYYYCHWILMFEAGKYTIHLTIAMKIQHNVSLAAEECWYLGRLRKMFELTSLPE